MSVFQQAELQKMRQQAQETKRFIDKQEADEHKLLKIIAEADVERLRQKKELDQVSHGFSRLRITLASFPAVRLTPGMKECNLGSLKSH